MAQPDDHVLGGGDKVSSIYYPGHKAVCLFLFALRITGKFPAQHVAEVRCIQLTAIHKLALYGLVAAEARFHHFQPLIFQVSYGTVRLPQDRY